VINAVLLYILYYSLLLIIIQFETDGNSGLYQTAPFLITYHYYGAISNSFLLVFLCSYARQ